MTVSSALIIPQRNNRERRRVTEPLPVEFASVEYLVAYENIASTWKKVRSNKGSAGVDHISIERFPKWVRPKWHTIKKQLMDGTYTPTPALRVEIPKESGGMRKLGILCILDRVVMQSIAGILGKLFYSNFSQHSYGYMPSRSVQQAARKVQEYYQQGYRFQVNIDLEHFFDTVNHDVLMHQVTKRLKNKDLLKLIGRFLRAGVMIDAKLQPTTSGVPQGSPVSPILSNIL